MSEISKESDLEKKERKKNLRLVELYDTDFLMQYTILSKQVASGDLTFTNLNKSKFAKYLNDIEEDYLQNLAIMLILSDSIKEKIKQSRE